MNTCRLQRTAGDGILGTDHKRGLCHADPRDYPHPADGTGADTGAAGGEAGGISPGGEQMGKGSFPNKRILRNNLCLPACKLLYLDKREKTFY